VDLTEILAERVHPKAAYSPFRPLCIGSQCKALHCDPYRPIDARRSRLTNSPDPSHSAPTKLPFGLQRSLKEVGLSHSHRVHDRRVPPNETPAAVGK
jgi:hypothetical protein